MLLVYLLRKLRILGTMNSSWWVPRLLAPDQKHIRLITSQENVTLSEADSASFIERSLTQYEGWVHHFEQKTKRQSMHWKHPHLLSLVTNCSNHSFDSPAQKEAMSRKLLIHRRDVSAKSQTFRTLSCYSFCIISE